MTQRRRVAFVTGGTRGIGGAITRRLARDGVAVTATYLSRAEEAARLRAELVRAGAEVTVVRTDVGDAAALLAAMDAAAARSGGLDILVSNAAMALGGALAEYPPDAFDRMFAVNVRAPFLAAQRAAALMTAGGRIVTIGSTIAAHVPGATLYAASKAALLGMTKGLARDLGPRGITANLVQPGPIDTERNPADGPGAAASRAPLAITRHGTPDEVAELVAYLTSEAAGFVTGAAYNIDGGWSA